MPKRSAGVLLYRFVDKVLQVFLVHPGGPFWAKKDEGVWSIPKGEFDDNEDPLVAAKREFQEETSIFIEGEFLPLTPVRTRSGKLVYPFALEQDVDETKIESNTFLMEWPPKSGKQKAIPEVDKAAWFEIETSKKKINPGQLPVIEELVSLLHQNNLNTG